MADQNYQISAALKNLFLVLTKTLFQVKGRIFVNLRPLTYY